MNVVIRTDASINIGSGHVMRCLVLAEELDKRGYTVSFVCRALLGDMIDFIQERGFSVFPLNEVISAVTLKHSADYIGWLQCSIEQDASDFLSQIHEADIVITDHYAIGKEWHSIIRNKLNCHIVAIDDLNRTHDADLIIDQNLWRDLEFRYISCKGRKLLGPKYALLRPSFHKLRECDIQKKDQIIAFFGGSDLTKECFKLVEALCHFNNDLPFSVKVIAGLSNPNFEELQELSKNINVEVVRYLDNFDVVLRQSKYIFGASGVSNWERFCLRVPASVVSVADNQKELSEYLSELGVMRYLGNSDQVTPDTYLNELIYLKLHWPNVGASASIEVDGLGAVYVVDEIGKI